MKNKYLFTSESVTAGHPDKVCDQISDAILDKLLEYDSESRVACETLATTGLILVSGEITTKAYVNIQKIVRKTLENIGYTNSEFGISSKGTSVLVSLDEQAEHIAQGVNKFENHEQGAGDQGLMFGYACNETPELMPLPITLAHRMAEKLHQVREDGTLPWLRPDGKTQVTVEYENNIPVCVKKTVIATQHDDMLYKFDNEEEKERKFIENKIINHVIKPTLEKYNIPYEEDFIVNGTGRFVIGGPQADTGLTGRKIIVDTYGGYARHGGGAFSGKDPSKVDRSAAYMARYVAKNIVAAKLSTKCEVQLAYCIGVAEPVSVSVDTFGTGTISDSKITDMIKDVFDFRPNEIIKRLDLKKPIYQKLAAYGHFGRPNLTWEKIDMVNEILKRIEK
jgi:S-adenosylmethionine synthetase